MQFYKTFREVEAHDDGKISGYASAFNLFDSYGDTILSTAYDNVLVEKQTPLMFFNHDRYEVPIGKWTSLSKDEIGLKVEGALDLSQEKAQVIYNAIKFGSITGLSVGMQVNDEDYEAIEDNHHRIKNVAKLYEISIVNFPADESARILTVKSDFNACNNITDFERCLRDAGASRNKAKEIISIAKRVLANQREVEKQEEIKLKIQQILNRF